MTERDSAGDERGAVAVLSVFMAVFLVALLFWMISIGSALLYRERMQEAADAAVFSSAVMHARGMNLIALINIVMSGLLAVLVAFKLLESLVTLGIVACVACLVAGLGVCPPAAALPELIQLREHIREVQQTVKPAVVSGLSMLHAGARGVRAFMPHASQLTAAATVLEHYHPPAELALVTVPRDTLPTRDDAYSVLCHHAGELAASLALEPLPFLKGVVRREVKHAVADLVESDPDWFCAADDAHRGPPTSKYHYDAGVPPLPSEQKCFDSATTDAAKDACAAAAKDGEHAAPDPI
ncbi:MAG TPA: hypothetical protein VHM19_05085, partial [Polyangiales bacterium]|nr:hypothetical protein [Polyangiales bacterium]